MVWLTVTTVLNASVGQNLFGLFCGGMYVSGSCLLVLCRRWNFVNIWARKKTTATPSHRDAMGQGTKKNL